MAEGVPGRPVAVLGDLRWMTTIVAALPAVARIALVVMVVIEMTTVRAVLVGTTTTTVGEASGRLRDAPQSTTTLLPEVATRIPTPAVTTLLSRLMPTAGLHTTALLQRISDHRVMAALATGRRGTRTRETMTVGGATGNSSPNSALVAGL